MENEYYFRNELEIRMSDFINDVMSDDHPFGYIPDGLSRLMADAAFNVLETLREIDQFHVSEKTNFGEE